MNFQGLFGGGTGTTETPDTSNTVREDGEYQGDYKVATEEDMEWLSRLL